jgi:hypothetical protein
MLDATVGTAVVLDASKSRDRDKHTLQYSWFFYPEAGSGLPGSGGGRVGGGAPGPGTPPAGRAANPGRATGIPPGPRGGRGAQTPRVTVSNNTSAVATVMPNSAGVAHVIVAVTDNGTPALTSYRRVILTIGNVGR